jgi:hypothetical protein
MTIAPLSSNAEISTFIFMMVWVDKSIGIEAGIPIRNLAIALAGIRAKPEEKNVNTRIDTITKMADNFLLKYTTAPKIPTVNKIPAIERLALNI